ncbi:MAG: glycoside hydrolase family 2 TIM barrel-domain containing protein [Verrucomicrobiota bacterium]
MKPTQILLLATLVAAILPAAARTIESLDRDWAFFQGDAKGAEKPGFDTAAWRKLDVPHDWSIEGDFDKAAPTTGSGGWLPSGVAWYRKEITLPAEAKGKRVWVEFDGVMANSDVWLNGKLLGHRPNGYVSFRYDLTDLLAPEGPNTLVVRADTSAQPASRWYSGAGIYRHVRLVTAHPVHVEPWGVYVTTPEATEAEGTVKIQTSIKNTSDKAGKITLRTALVGPDGKSVSTVNSEATLDPGKQSTVSQQIKVPRPALWSLESPQLHTIVTRITAGDSVLDEVTTPFGIRSAEFKSDTGFWLNGKNLKLKGVCLHHDGGAVGAAVPLAVWERRLRILQELGVNSIRTAHNPTAPEFLDLCDRMGFLVMDEFFDCWTKGKNKHDYHLYFKEWSHTDLRDGIMRDRNHPSVILYGVGNEIHDTPKPELAKPILRGLVDVCHEVDPSRPVTQALFRPNVSGDYKNGLADMLDVIGTNYRDKELLDAWKDKSGRKIVGTEQGHERSTWLACRDNPQHSGQFLWCGIDYLGESRSWPLTVYNVGLLDRAGFVQARGYERQSWWSDKPMVRVFRRVGVTASTPADPGYEALEWQRRQVLFPDWNPSSAEPHEENVEIYSNAEEVELFLNDKSLGKKATRKDGGAINWQVPYQPGTLKAVATNNRKEAATDSVRTAGKPLKIALIPDRKSLGTTFDDVANVEIQLVDENGTVVPTAAHPVTFTVTGPGKILGLDSGNVMSTERFQANQRKAYQGRALAILRATAAGKLTLTAKVEGLPLASVELTAP